MEMVVRNLGHILGGSSSTFALVSAMERANWISVREAKEASLVSVSEVLETSGPRPCHLNPRPHSPRIQKTLLAPRHREHIQGELHRLDLASIPPKVGLKVY